MGSRQSTQQTVNQAQNSTQTATPFAPAAAGLTSGVQGLTDWMNSPAAQSVYQGPRVAQMSGNTQAGINQMASGGTLPEVQAALQQMMSGNNFNPFNSAMEDAARTRAMQAVNQRVSDSGMAPGGSVDQALLSRELTNALAPIQAQAWDANQNRIMQAAGMMPGVNNAITQGMIGAGQLQEGYDQANINANLAQFNEQQTAGIRPYATALPLLSQVGGQFGTNTSSGTTNGTTSGTTQNNPSPLQTALGVGMMGAGLMSGMGGMGALGGMFGASSGGGLLGALNAGQLGNVGQSVVYNNQLPQLGMIGRGY